MSFGRKYQKSKRNREKILKSIRLKYVNPKRGGVRGQ
jgi:hypothetical protein